MAKVKGYLPKPRSGWFKESLRHALASKGIKSGRKTKIEPSYATVQGKRVKLSDDLMCKLYFEIEEDAYEESDTGTEEGAMPFMLDADWMDAETDDISKRYELSEEDTLGFKLFMMKDAIQPMVSEAWDTITIEDRLSLIDKMEGVREFSTVEYDDLPDDFKHKLMLEIIIIMKESERKFGEGL